MKGSLGKDAKQRRVRTGIDQRNPNIFRSEARGSKQRGVSFPIALEIDIRAGTDQGVDERKLFPFFKLAYENHVRDVVERMGVDLGPISPGDERIRTRGVLGEQMLKCFGVSGFNCMS